MVDRLSAKRRSALMSSVRSTNTSLELRVRSALHRLGLRFRVRNRLKGRPDIVFPTARTVVFIDSCFWHACPQHPRSPKSRLGYWGPKLAANAARDREVTLALRADGWHVIRIWEHDVKRRCDVVVRRLEAVVRTRAAVVASRRR